MRTILNGVIMSLASTLLITLLTLSITKTYAQEPVQITQQQTNSLQEELIDIFFAAVKTNNQEVIHEFLENKFPVDVRNRAGYTPLMVAAYYGHQDTVTTLLEYGADLCVRDSRGNTAMMGAIFKLEWSIVKQLRQVDVDCDSKANQTGQKTAAEFAKVLGQEDKFNSLFQVK